MSQSREKELATSITEPGELDVLCGRGGMSNHHPGNEWYRRLIKSNRPLYRACPKHTKLLVSKAIVQAVEQQGGRFLDKDRKSNTWFEVTYKRAVDKTSQGLRERERDDDNTTVSADSKPVIMPPPLRTGSTTMGISTQQQQQQPQHSLTGTSTTPKKTTFAANLETTLQPRPANDKNTISGLRGLLTGATAGVLKKRSNPAFTSTTQYGDSESKAKRIRAESPTAEEEDLAPLPPTLQQRESSMFRLLTNTKLLFAHGETPGAVSGQQRPAANTGTSTSTTTAMSQYPTRLNNLGNPNQVNKTVRGKGATQLNHVSKQQSSIPKETQEALHQSDLKKMQEEAFRQQLLGEQQQQQMFLGQTSLFNAQQQSIQPPSAATMTMGIQPQAQRAPPPAPVPQPVGSAAPALTRLTSQMSDWLTSFFPVASRGESIANFGARGESIANFRPVATANDGHSMANPNGIQRQQQRMSVCAPQLDSARLYEELTQNGHRNAATKVAKFEREVAPKIVNLPPPKVEIPEINTIPPMRAGADDRGAVNYTDETQQNYESQMDGNAPKRNKRKSGHSLPELPRDTRAMIAPTELEQSVSATLLKLASTPSRLYNGISSLFGGATDTQGPGMDDSNNNTMMGSKRNSTSLLEDDEEDELSMEMRMRGMRGVAGGRPSNRSLLEDDEDKNSRRAMVGKRSKGSLLDDEDEDDSFRGSNSTNTAVQPLWARH